MLSVFCKTKSYSTTVRLDFEGHDVLARTMQNNHIPATIRVTFNIYHLLNLFIVFKDMYLKNH